MEIFPDSIFSSLCRNLDAKWNGRLKIRAFHLWQAASERVRVAREEEEGFR